MGSAEVDASNSAELALNSIKEAAAAGADVSEPVERFNLALSLLHQANTDDFENCSYNECVTRANKIFIGISQDSTILREQTQDASNYQRMMTFAFYAPLAAFTSSILCLYSYNAWKSYQVKKFLDMEVSEKED
ncbi:MAG: hypothetical protein ACE5KA_02535 [Nitrososphaerales archaeon]